jgi:hypothetical protein
MTGGTSLDHALIRDYLRAVDTAFAALSSAQARELRQQIVAHLADALPQGAVDEEVVAALDRLGAPSELAAEAAAGRTPEPPSAVAVRRMRIRIGRLSWTAWALVAAAVIVVGAGTAYLVAFLTAGSIQSGGGTGWLYAQDYTREVNSQADLAMQTTAPIRSGQRQGLILNIYNPSNWTQTVLGLAPGGSPFGTPLQIGVSRPNVEINRGGMIRNVSYTLPEAIPPHQFREVRVQWTSTVCLAKGAEVGIDQIRLQVRIGWTVRTDMIPLNQGFYLSGPSKGPCEGRQ